VACHLFIFINLFICPTMLDKLIKHLESGKLVFADPVPKDNEAATWREKLDQLYKSSSQSFRVVVHGSKVCISFLYVGVLTFFPVSL